VTFYGHTYPLARRCPLESVFTIEWLCGRDPRPKLEVAPMQKDPDPKPCGATAPYSYNQRKRARLGKIAVQRSVVRFAAEYSSILSPRDVVFTLAPAENPGNRHLTVGASSSMSPSSGPFSSLACRNLVNGLISPESGTSVRFQCSSWIVVARNQICR
jgi:hypothetical protein